MKKSIIVLLFILTAIATVACNSKSGSSKNALLLLFTSSGEDNSNIKTVTYDGNGNTGGSVPIDNNIYEKGQTVIVLANTGNLVKFHVSQTSYRFVGWNTSADGTGTDFPATGTDILTMGSGKIILYTKWIPYAVFDIGPAGGIIFYDAITYSSKGWRYLEAAPYDENTDIEYYPGGATGTGTSIGTGKKNTELLVSFGSPVAQICSSLGIGGYNDWFLPSKDELQQMYHISKMGGFNETVYWSSSNYSSIFTWVVNFADGTANYIEEKSFCSVRAIRAF